MAHEIHLEKHKYRQWVKAGQGLVYLKEGLAPFCDDIGNQQHKDIINKIQQTQTPQPNIPCGCCQITTLKPDHVRVSKGICPLKQDKCNCCFPNNKRPCPNNVCGAIYDSIIQYHASMPPAPFWKNSDVQQWTTDPWSINKCFINTPGYKDKTSAVDTDCSGLLHVIVNNKYFHSHIGCNVTGPNNLFSKVRQYRNEIFHSTSMELEESKANCYIDDMIAVLQDGKELIQRQDAQRAVGKLQDLKKKDFIITTEDFKDILRQIKDEMVKVLKSTENAATKSKEEYEDLKNKLNELKAQMSEAEKEHKELKRKFTVLETEQKEEIKRLKVEDYSQQKQLENEKAKSEWREKLIERYHKTLLQVPTSPLQPKSEKCSFNEIYIRPKITREIRREKGEIEEVEVTTMSEIFTKDGFPQKSVYVLGDAGSGKTSFCKYLVNCWCLAHSEEHEADKENEDSSGKLEGDSEKHGGDGKKHGGDGNKHGAVNENKGYTEEHGGDNEKHEKHGAGYENEGGTEEHGNDNEGHETHVGVNENEGDNEKHGGDYEEHEKKGSYIVNEEVKGTHSGDIENEEGSKTDRGVNEERGDEKHVGGIKKNGGDSDDSQDNSDFLIHSESNNDDSDDILNDSKSDNDDSDDILNDSESNNDDSDDILNDSESDSDDTNDILNDSKSDSDDSYTDSTDSEFDSEFVSDDSEHDSENYELKFNGVKEMKKFHFVFYIPLRQYQNIDTIDEMLQNRYQMKMLSTLLEEESSTVMILLDGLDEWSSENVPEHSIFKEYTIVTTSRPWKFHTLRSSHVEIEQSLKLKGFDFRCEGEMVKRTVSQLNVRRNANKEAGDCKERLEEKSLESLKQVPIMLQQLICLWFDGKLEKTSRCAIYTGMLELFFTWNDMKTTRTSTGLMKATQKVILPQFLAERTKLRLNSHFIHDVSQLAYVTLFNYPKDKSLTFDICLFDELEISDEVRENCLKLGIITEDECQNLFVSEPPSSLFSFIHKTMQEFLAAVNIGINFKARIGSSDSTGNVELAKKFINEVFQKHSTVNDILELSNVMIMLCGLEPRLATHVSKYIYDTVSEDSHFQEYRRTISRNIYMDHSCITVIQLIINDIQKLMFESMEEVDASCSIGSNPVFYIGDLLITNWSQHCDIVCSSIDQHHIVPDSVLSIYVDDINTKNVKFKKYLPIFHHLEKIKMTYQSLSQMLSSTPSHSAQSNKQMFNEISNCVSETLKVNTLTLKSLSLDRVYDNDKYYPMCKTVLSYQPSMVNLVAIRICRITMSHDDTTTFCNILEGTSHFEQLYLNEVDCDCENQHDVNLSKHQKLQYLHLYNTFSVIDADTTNLEILRLKYLKNDNYNRIFDIITKSYKLKELKLCGEFDNESQLYHTKITKRLVTVLPLLQNLSKLKLYDCRFSDNIIQVPFEMKSLNVIKLFYATMSFTTWRKFVDSLPSIPHTVDVIVMVFYITGDGDGLTNTPRKTLKGEKGNDAIQYVKDLDQLFHVKHNNLFVLNFSTKK